MNELLLIAAFGLWAGLVTLRALRFEPPQQVALQRFLVAVFVGLLAVCLVNVWGVWPAFGATLLLLGLAEALAKTNSAAKSAKQGFQKHQGGFAALAKKLAWLLKPLAPSPPEEVPAFSSMSELLDLLAQDKTVLSDEQKTALKHRLHFDEKTVKQTMTPRKNIASVKVDETLGPLLIDTLHKTGHACFPVVGKDLNDIKGLLYLEDITTLNPKFTNVKDAIQARILYAHADWPLPKLLAASLHAGRHLFIVVDDTQKTVGLITMTDVLKQLTGQDHGVNMPADYENRRNVAGLTKDSKI